jgi:hypothetical protein
MLVSLELTTSFLPPDAGIVSGASEAGKGRTQDAAMSAARRYSSAVAGLSALQQ